MNNNIENLLSDWGRTQRQMPLNSQTLKSEILAKLPLSNSDVALPKTSRIPWLPLAFAGMAVISFIILSPAKKNPITGTLTNYFADDSSRQNILEAPQDYVKEKDGTANLENSQRKSEAGSMAPSSGISAPDSYAPSYPYYPPQPQPEVPITDNQFLKTDYRASVKTHNVQKMTAQLQTTVRGFDGRIDAVNSSEKYGFISFVVPESRFAAFQAEVKALAGERFILENTSTENLLPEKRSIEEQITTAQSTLAQLNSDKEKLIASHNKIVSQIQGQLKQIANQIADLQIQLANHPEQKAIIEAQIRDLQTSRAKLNASLASENSQYNNKIIALDAQIKYAQSNLESANKQDTNLLNTVATVRGSISLSHISWFGILGLYLPGYWIPFLLLLAAVVLYGIDRHHTRLINV